MPKYHVVARSMELVEFDVEGDDLTHALELIQQRTPEGFQVQSYMTVK